MFKIEQKVALVSGGASGIGLAIAKALLDHSLKALAIVDISKENGDLTLKELKTQYGDIRVIFIETDVSDKIQFDNAFQCTIQSFGHLDIVINSAGVSMEPQWDKVVAVNLTGTVNGTILAIENYLPNYKTDDETIVINVSSISGLDAVLAVPTYSATKSGVIALTRAYGSELHYERSHVRAMAICPGYTDTPMAKYRASKYLSNDHFAMLKKQKGEIYFQNPNKVGDAVIHMINEGKTGSVWVVEDDQPPYEVELLVRKMGKTLSKY